MLEYLKTKSLQVGLSIILVLFHFFIILYVATYPLPEANELTEEIATKEANELTEDNTIILLKIFVVGSFFFFGLPVFFMWLRQYQSYLDNKKDIYCDKCPKKGTCFLTDSEILASNECVKLFDVDKLKWLWSNKWKYPKDSWHFLREVLHRKTLGEIHLLRVSNPLAIQYASIYGAMIALDRFMLGQKKLAWLKLLTLGGACFWILIDWLIIYNKTKKINLKKLLGQEFDYKPWPIRYRYPSLFRKPRTKKTSYSSYKKKR